MPDSTPGQVAYAAYRANVAARHTLPWLFVYAGTTCAALGVLVLYALQPVAVPWWRWLGTSLVLGWFSGLTAGMRRRYRVEEAHDA